MRFHRPLTFALTVLPSADIVRTIKSFEPAAKTLLEREVDVCMVASRKGNGA